MRKAEDERLEMVPVLEVPADDKGFFLERPNRFLARVKLSSGEVAEVHVHDPGRLPQILFPGNEVLLKRAVNPRRRTKWSLLAGRVEDHWVFTNSGYHRRLAERILKDPLLSPFGPLKALTPEPVINDGRLDFFLETEAGGRIYVEIKGCTLAQGEVALFPDAPTTRGTKHMRELLFLRRQGFRAAVWFLIFRSETTSFEAARTIDPLFAKAFEEVLEGGVELVTTKFFYDGHTLFLVL